MRSAASARAAETARSSDSPADSNSAWLTRWKTVKILVEGHCDERGTEEYNLALGERRANSAKKYLEGLGVNAARISTISYGEERPLDPGHTEEARSKNRRDEFVESK